MFKEPNPQPSFSSQFNGYHFSHSDSAVVFCTQTLRELGAVRFAPTRSLGLRRGAALFPDKALFGLVSLRKDTVG